MSALLHHPITAYAIALPDGRSRRGYKSSR